MTAAIPSPWEQPLMPLWPDAAELLGIRSRSAAHDAADRGEIPTMRIGARRLVATAQLLALVGLDVPPHPSIVDDDIGLAARGRGHASTALTP